MIRQRIQNGMTLPQRDLMPDEVQLYRGKAESYLQVLAAAAVKAEKPNMIYEQIVMDIRRASSFWYPGVTIGVVAWLLSLVITVLVTSQAPEGLMKWAMPYLNTSAETGHDDAASNKSHAAVKPASEPGSAKVCFVCAATETATPD